MKNQHPVSDYWSPAFACVCTAVLFVSALPPAFAGEQSMKDVARRAGHVVGAVVHDIGHGAKKAGKAIGGAAKEAGKEFRNAVKGEQH